MLVVVRDEMPGDLDQIRHVNRQAFGQDAEARLVDALRAGGFAPVSLVAEHSGKVVGHILFSTLEIVMQSTIVPALALAPMAVLPNFQRQGVGTQLVRRGLQVCRERGHRIVVVLGHPEYYPRFGFSSTLAETLESPYGGGPAHMAVALIPNALEGVQGKLIYAPPFSEL